MPPKVLFPRMNLYYHEGSTDMVTAIFELPGLKPGDVAINLLHDKLTISGEFVDYQPQRATCAFSELSQGKFSRALTVPLGTRPEDFKARMENGVLTLTYPKNPPEPVPHRIPIEYICKPVE